MITSEQLRGKLAEIADVLLFEHNTKSLRFQAADEMNDWMLSEGIAPKDYFILCDETNNTPEVIDGNRFVISVFRNIDGKWIEMKMEMARTGIEFS